MKYCPQIIKENKLKRFCTPIIVLKYKGKIKHFFFTLDEYNTFIQKNDIHDLTIQYYKGLGSWEKEDLFPLIQKYGMDYFIRTISFDENAVEIVDNWLNGKKAEKRKEYLRENTFSIFNV